MPILLVEDNLIIGNALRDHIAAEGWSIDWSLDLHAAMAAVELRAYALILLDLHLPDGPGLDLLRHLGRHPPMPPVIILSAYDQYSDRAEGLTLGAVDYLVKPFDLSEMTRRIDRLAKRLPIHRLADCTAYRGGADRPAPGANGRAKAF